MDQLKKILKTLKKHQFWVVCGVVLLVAMGCWWWATRGLAGQFQQRKTKLEGEFKNVVIPPSHPNQGMIDKIHQLQDALKRGVFRAWEILYTQQKEKNLLPKELDEEFKTQFEKLRDKPGGELARVYREQYQNFIKKHLPRLKVTVDARRPPEEKEAAAGEAKAAVPGNRPRAEGGLGPERRAARAPGLPGPRLGGRPGVGERAAAADDEWIGTVDWNESDYRALENRFDWSQAPSTLAVVLAQEDLWVIEALLRVIANTNEGTTYATAAVKQIRDLQIGKDAVGGRQGEESIFRAGPAGGGAAPGGMPPGGMPPGGMPAGGSGAGAGAGGDDQRLIDGRYVDKDDKPLSYIPEYPYAKHPYAEFKMMPIRMHLVMDQRRLPKLLVECANSNMPIEVKRVRILKGEGGVLNLAAAAGAVGPGMEREMRGGGFRGAAAPQGFEGGGRPARATTDKQESGPFDVPVEIYGVIYIYNPPDREKLGTGAASAEKPAGEAAPVAPATPAPAVPAAAPPAAVPAARGGPPDV